MGRGLYKRPARAADAPVTDVEVRAIVRLAGQLWYAREPERGGGILVAQFGPAAYADSPAVRGRRPEAAWLVDHAGAQPLTIAEAGAMETDRRLIEGSSDFYYPIFGFAPLLGTNHLVLGRFCGVGIGRDHGGVIGVGARGGIWWGRSPLW